MNDEMLWGVVQPFRRVIRVIRVHSNIQNNQIILKIQKIYRLIIRKMNPFSEENLPNTLKKY